MRSTLRNDPHKTLGELSQGCVYKLIFDCSAVYIRETEQRLLEGFTEHLKDETASQEHGRDSTKQKNALMGVVLHKRRPADTPSLCADKLAYSVSSVSFRFSITK
ncbi:hypothetical protein M514_06157 [Trichuris suis]|uniref:Uncharacterized protein n=1 Tax=Trichuris suis TaxID=68888 RepID=A0A085M745_9BILA|nr:hypothetical protein M513_06157 [Trichuris suis]KFD69818.1 hypothetical protein M514_06157 [Trichuris suis]